MVLILATSLTACVSASPVAVAQSQAPREKPQISDTEKAEVAKGGRTFALDLYHQIGVTSQGNLILSPYSITLPLAMLYAGAHGETEQQIRAAAHFTAPQSAFHSALNVIDSDLFDRASDETRGFQLNIANSVWGEQGYSFRQDYLDTLAKNYGSGIQLVDFEGQSEGARLTINHWVEQKTQDKVKDILPPNAITPDVRLVLANAIYFRANWESQFDVTQTHPQDFHLMDGTTVSVPTMFQVNRFNYRQFDKYQIIELPYLAQDFSMLIILPNAEDFDDLDSQFTVEDFDNSVEQLQPTDLSLSLPKFKIQSNLSLPAPLKALGMVNAFDPSTADFTGIGQPSLYIGEGFHSAEIEVNEDGTEAAAATVIVAVTEAAMPLPELEVKVDHPFIFAIYDRYNGMILFLGRVMNPVGSDD